MICRFCKTEVKRVAKDGFCRKCGPMIRASIKDAKLRRKVSRNFVGPPTFAVYCADVRTNARCTMWKAIRAGRIIRLAESGVRCVDCGELATCYDHRDYTKPLMVEPVCGGCNAKRGVGFPHRKFNLIPLDDLVPKN